MTIITHNILPNMAKCHAQKLHPKEYKAWLGMKYRCSGNSYHTYTKNNITVCDYWLQSFWNFFHDVGKAPGPEYSLDRIDNLKGYYKENVRWATSFQQANNRSIPDFSHRLRDSNGKFIKENTGG